MKRSPLTRKSPLRKVSARRLGQRIHYSRIRGDVEARSNGRCELRTPACTGRGSECHHLLPRSAGGPDDMGNCVWTCPPCHLYVHLNPAESYERGWLRRRSA